MKPRGAGSVCDFGDTVTGSIPVKVNAEINNASPEVRMSVDADLTQVKIDNLLPGWVKPAGKPAHANGTLVRNGKDTTFRRVTITGAGRDGEGIGRDRRSERARVGEFPGVQSVGRRQGHAQGRSRQRRRVTRGDAWRCL